MRMSTIAKHSHFYTQTPLPHGVEVLTLETHQDNRGRFTELFREQWSKNPHPVQWNFVQSHAHTLRGAHVHLVHHDFYTLLHGEEMIILKDLRIHSPTYSLSAVLKFNAAKQINGIHIPPGVAHGLYCFTDSLNMVGVSEYYDTADELSCHWQDPDLGVTWPCTSPIISTRDHEAPSVKEVLKQMETWQSTQVF